MAVVLKKYITKKGKDIPHLYVDEKTGTFYVRKRVGNSTPKKSLETNIETTAILKIYDAIKSLEEGERLKSLSEEDRKKEEENKTANLLVRDFYKFAIDEKERLEVKASTIRRIDTVWRNNIEPFCGNLKPDEIINPDADFINEFMRWHKKAKPGVQFSNTFKYLGNIFRIMAERGAIPLDKIPKLELPRPEQKHHKAKKGRIIEKDDFLNILKFVTIDPLVFELAFTTGMRQMEIGAMRQDQVIKRGSDYYFDFSWQDTKTGIERFVPIPPALIEKVLALRGNGSPYLFPAPTDLSKHVSAKVIHANWTAAKTKAKIVGKMRFHDMRHTVATGFVKSGINPLLIATYLGMNIKTLQEKYLKLAPEDLLVINRSVIDLEKRGDQ